MIDHEPHRRSQRLICSNVCLLVVVLILGQASRLAADETSPDRADQPAQRLTPAELELRMFEKRGIRSNPYRAGRSITVSRRGIVASEHYLASLAGLDLLRSGGTAMDAAIAVASTLSVVEPMMTGPGGDVFVLYYEAATGKIHALNGSGRAPKNLTLDYFRSRGKTSIDDNSWEAVTVPGAVDAWLTAHKRFGRIPIEQVLAPAIHHAEEGFPVSEIVSMAWSSYGGKLSRDPWSRRTYLVDGRPPKFGTLFKNRRLAESFRQIADRGRVGFYEGPIAQEIVRYAQETGGFFTMEDFAGQHSEWVEPISTNYRGYDVYQCPPNGQGIGVLIMLNILEGYDLAEMEFNSPEYRHLLIEAKKLAYADLYRYVADPRASEVPIQELLSKQYAAKRRALIDRDRAADDVAPGVPVGSDTTYFTVIDEQGNAASFINSLYSAFGSGIVGGKTGVMLHNRGALFSLEEGHPNVYAPGKRPYHTIIPGMVLKDEKLYLSYGLMGGAMQPQGHVQFLLAHLDHGLPIQEAIDTPRWRHMAGLEVRLEHGTPRSTFEALEALGHKVRPANLSDFGASQAILVDPDTGTYYGASDPRRDGMAIGY